MVNGMNPWGNGNLIPRGTLREPMDELKRADIVIIHHADLVNTHITNLFVLWYFSLDCDGASDLHHCFSVQLDFFIS